MSMTMTKTRPVPKAAASAVSRIIRAEASACTRRLVQVLQAANGSTTVYTANGARHQAAALSRARRALVARGYGVETLRGGAGLPLAPHLYYLIVTGREVSTR